MKKILTLFLLAIFFTGIGMAAATFGPIIAEALKTEDNIEPAEGVRESDAASTIPGSQIIPQPTIPESVALPRVLSADPMTVEDIVRYGHILGDQQAFVHQKTAEVNHLVSQLAIVEQDLAGGRLAMDGMRDEVEELVRVAENLVEQLETQRSDIQQQTNELDTKLETLDSADGASGGNEQNIKKLATLMQNMPAEMAAKYITEIADGGKMDLVIKVLYEIDDRAAAKILAETSPALARPIADAFSKTRRTAKNTQ